MEPQPNFENHENQTMSLMEKLVCEHGIKINEGNNGIILFFRYDEIPAEFREDFFENESIDDDLAVKVLKIYSERAAEKEFGMQRKAQEILQNAGAFNDPTFAQVPHIYKQKTIPLNAKARNMLRGRIGCDASQHVSFLVMDFIKGDDLMTHLLKELITRDKRSTQNMGFNSIEDMSFNEMFAECGRLCGYQLPGGKSGNPNERLYEEKKVMMQNATKLINRLKALGYKPHPTIISQIKKTMDLFHENGLYFRDGHQRNFMLSEREGDGPQVHVIDFGSTVFVGNKLEGAYVESVYDDEMTGHRCVDDGYIIRFLETFSRNEVLDNEQKIIAAKKSKIWKNIFPNLEAEISSSDDSALVLEMFFRKLQKDRVSDIELFILMGEELCEKGLLDRPVFKSFLESKTDLVPYACKIHLDRAVAVLT